MFAIEQQYYSFMYDRFMRVGSRRTQDEYGYDLIGFDDTTIPTYPALVPNTRYYFKFVIKWTIKGYSCTDINRLFYRDPQNSTFTAYSFSSTSSIFRQLMPTGTPLTEMSPPVTVQTPENPTYTLKKVNNKYYFATLNLGNPGNVINYAFTERFVCLFYTTSRTSDQDSEMYWYNKSKSVENWVEYGTLYPTRGTNSEYKVETYLYSSTRLNHYDLVIDDLHYDILKVVSDRSSDAVNNGEFPIGATIYTKLCVFYMVERGLPNPVGFWKAPSSEGSNHYFNMFTVSDWVEITV